MADNIKRNPETPALSIAVDDGSRRVPIFNLDGDQIGEFKFHPTDIGIVNRFNEMAGEFDKIIQPLENVNIGVDGNAEDDNSAEAIAAFDDAVKRLFGAVDYIFGGNASEAFFSGMHPFSPVGDNFYCMQVLEKVSDFIGQQFNAEMQKIDTRITKHTGKYKSGKRSYK